MNAPAYKDCFYVHMLQSKSFKYFYGSAIAAVIKLSYKSSSHVEHWKIPTLRYCPNFALECAHRWNLPLLPEILSTTQIGCIWSCKNIIRALKKLVTQIKTGSFKRCCCVCSFRNANGQLQAAMEMQHMLHLTFVMRANKSIFFPLRWGPQKIVFLHTFKRLQKLAKEEHTQRAERPSIKIREDDWSVPECLTALEFARARF